MLAAAALPAVSAAVPDAAGSGYQVDVEYSKLPNGLKVVLSRDTTAPVAVVAVYYNIGFRIEPRDRTGFAHLFEHMMFQGSENLGKMEFIKLVTSNGGTLNGSTRFDFTNFFEIVPSNALETPSGPRPTDEGLAITGENLKFNRRSSRTKSASTSSQPYGGFPARHAAVRQHELVPTATAT